MLKEQNDCGLTSIYFGETLVRNWTLQSLQDNVTLFHQCISELTILSRLQFCMCMNYHVKHTIVLYNVCLAHYCLSYPCILLPVILCRSIFFNFLC